MSEGNVLKKSNMQTRFTKAINQASGQLSVDLAGHSASGANGDGSILTVMFEVTGIAPQSQITVAKVEPTRAGGQLAYTAPAPYVVALGK